ncbi:uncharacterized protein A4U43_C02F12640 [Asparagus officinalis]|uniref:NF-kappa-B-activating protein C-terminal domain-containing protein n=1 Tax=Asparagus officinalis TaxID=4686 RepID=A0A5P1FMN9_ASPOF|nr:uncharacterized protein A4U43_C02F12640 [Asparagus officinalis]
MNAIRIRKENQLYSAEDKRALAMFNYEEKAKREHKVMADLERLVQRHIGQDLGPTHDPFGKDSAAGYNPISNFDLVLDLEAENEDWVLLCLRMPRTRSGSLRLVSCSISDCSVIKGSLTTLSKRRRIRIGSLIEKIGRDLFGRKDT